jgi:acyl carrier protein
MTRAEILAGIAAVAREHLDYEGELRLDQHLVEDLTLDSIRLLTLAAEVENRFRVSLDAGDEAGIETVGDLVDVLAAKLGAGT